MGVIDESGFAKKGDHSAGVARQYNGRLGKEDNCQVGVFLVGVTPGGAALLDHQLYLPESRGARTTRRAEERRAKVHIPETVAFQTKPQIAARLIRRTAVLGIVALDWITADEEYGRNGDFLDELETLEQPLRGRGPGQHDGLDRGPGRVRPALRRSGRVPTQPSRESVSSVAAVASAVGRRDLAAACVSAREPKGRWCFEFAAVRVWAVRHGEAGPADLAAGAAVVGGDARDQVLRQQRRAADAAGGAGPGGLHAAQGRGVISRTPRATWGWRSTRRGRGSAGTIT